MHRGWIKQYRKTVESEIWERPPLYFKVWSWLLMNADKNTGTVRRSLRGIAQEVAWTENNALRVPHARTMKAIMEWLVRKGMVTQRAQGAGNTQYQILTICNWSTYQSTEQQAGNTEYSKAGNTECLHNKNVQEVQEVQRERVAHAHEGNPISLSDTDLRPPAPDFDEEACFHHYLAEKQKHHRTRFLDMEVRRAIQVLHRDPTIEPRLGSEDIQLILSNWMEFGRPLKPHQLFDEHPSMEVPNWEACLWFARNRRNGTNHTRPQEEEIDIDTWLEKKTW